MSTLTKICVVVLVVLVLFASGPFIQQAVTGPNWKQAWEEQKQKTEVAEASARNYMLAAQVYQRLYESALEDAGKSKGQYLGIIGSKDVEIARLTGQLAARTGEVKELTTFSAAFELDLKAQIALNKEILADLEAKRIENGKISAQLRDVQYAVKEKQTNLEILSRSLKVIQEQLVQREVEIAELREQLAAGGVKVGPARPVVAVGAKIDATVTAVRGDLASLSAGSASGVKKDMEFIIYRGADFVAHLRIADVGVANSTGIVLDRKREPRVGDKATTNLE